VAPSDAAQRAAPVVTLPSLRQAEFEILEGRAGRLALYAAGSGRPMLLLHSVNAAPSVAEVRPTFDHFAASRRVYALDLPGFGSSERTPRRYDVRLYVDAIHAALEAISREGENVPVDAMALSLSAEFLARAACETPDRFRSLALVTPTGFDARSAKRRDPQPGNREIPGLHALVSVPLWRRGLFGLLTRPATIRYFMRRTFGRDDVDRELIDDAIRAARGPGAEYAPFAFLSGRLFSSDARRVYESLRGPVWLAHGTKGDFADFSGAQWAREDARFSVEAFDTGAMPHFELPRAFHAAYERFLASVD